MSFRLQKYKNQLIRANVYVSFFVFQLERHANHEAYALFVRRRQMVVVEAADVFNMHNLEDVVNACRHFPIRLFLVKQVGALGEVHQRGVAGVLLQERIVLVGELTPEAFHAEPFAPLQFA